MPIIALPCSRRALQSWAACALLALPFVPATSVADEPPIAIAASDETFAFTPSTVMVHAGQPVTLALHSSSGVHGVASAELGITTTLIRPNHPVNVTFTPAKVGTYIVHCAQVCGIGHAGMAFTVQVAP